MRIDDVAMTVTDDFYFFSNLPADLQKQTYHLNTSLLTDFNVSFLVLLKEFYRKLSFSKNMDTFDVYFSKNIDLSLDSLALIDRDSLSLTKNIQKVKDIVSKLNQLIPNTSKHIGIIDGSLNMDGMAWGMGIPAIGGNNDLILMDTSFWRENSLIHEMLHVYLPFQPQKEDSAYYFFSESMIEYLSICLSYEKKVAHAVFKQKIKKSKRKGYMNISVFALSDNRVDVSTNRGTSVVIYDKTPAVIDQFAQKTGGDEQFLKLLSLFYQQVQTTGEMTFRGFEQVLKSNGISDEHWQWFVQNL
jgi:hypothetical protein